MSAHVVSTGRSDTPRLREANAYVRRWSCWSGSSTGPTGAVLLPAAAGLEMIHTFSLIHDDLPALDDDDLRRGSATLHREFDEALAILAGDALLNLGLGLVASRPADAPAEHRLRAVRVAEPGPSVPTA